MSHGNRFARDIHYFRVWCRDCGKWRYDDRRAARRAMKTADPGTRRSAYPCPANPGFHIGRKGRELDTHECPAGCGARVTRDMFACKADWFRLPKVLRDRIWRAYRSGTAGEHMAAMAAATDWYVQNPRVGVDRVSER